MQANLYTTVRLSKAHTRVAQAGSEHDRFAIRPRTGRRAYRRVVNGLLA